MRNLNKLFSSAKLEGKDWKCKLQKILSNCKKYRQERVKVTRDMLYRVSELNEAIMLFQLNRELRNDEVGRKRRHFLIKSSRWRRRHRSQMCESAENRRETNTRPTDLILAMSGLKDKKQEVVISLDITQRKFKYFQYQLHD